MLGWWRLLLLYGIAINLGIDESVSTSLDVNGSKASDEKSSKGVNGSKASEKNGSTALHIKSSGGNGLNASEGNGPNASDRNGPNASDRNGSNTLDKNGSKASDLNIFTASDGNGSNASDGNGLNASDGNGPNASDGNGPNASGGNGLNASSRKGLNASDGNGPNASDRNGPNASGGNGLNASGGNGRNASGGNGLNASDGNGPNASGGNGLNASGGNGLNASSRKGLNASDENGPNASDRNGPNASGGNGLNASSGNGLNASDEDGPNASDVNGNDGNGPNASERNGPNASDGNGPNASDGNDPNASDGNGPNASDVNGNDGNGPNASGGNGPNASDGNGPNASSRNGPNASDGNGPNASDVKDTTALGVIGFNAVNKISLVNVRQKREPITLSLLTTTFVTALVTSAGTSAGQKLVGAIAGNGGVETGPREVFASSTRSCDEQCKCNWGNCVPKTGNPGAACCTAGYEWTCCEYKQLIKDITSTSVVSTGQLTCFKSPPLCLASSCKGDKKFYHFAKEKDETLKIEETIYEPDSCKQPHASIRGDFFIYDHADPNNVKAIIRPAFMLENFDECPKCGWEVCITKLDSLICTCCDHSRLGECRWGWTETCLYEPNILSQRNIACHNCEWKMRHSKDRFTCCDHETLKNCSAGLGVPKSAPLMTVRSNEVKKSDGCQLLIEEQCKCKWGNCFPRKGRAANKCCTDNYDLVCCQQGSNTADNSNGNASSIIAFFMATAQFIVGRILTKMVTN
uniref:Uncharacterized protein n=1 Tax=Globodera rostochiensis TaxID=31243 RepID=A0A914H7L4_GLORO